MFIIDRKEGTCWVLSLSLSTSFLSLFKHVCLVFISNFTCCCTGNEHTQIINIPQLFNFFNYHYYYYYKILFYFISQLHFQTWKLPRRTRDQTAEKEYFDRTGKETICYRRVREDEQNRGDLYPICNTGVKMLAHFGVGVGVYFIQLLILSTVMFFMGFYMIPALYYFHDETKYDTTSIGGVEARNGYLALTAMCEGGVMVTATVGCDDNAPSCQVNYRPNCELSYTVILMDLIMSITITVIIFATVFVENKVEEELDEAIQSAQDYSVMVKDPNPDADNPDEWYNFFSRFGKVRYITITRKNARLGELLVRRHDIERRIAELTTNKINKQQLQQQEKSLYFNCFPNQKSDPSFWKQKLDTIDRELSKIYLDPYPVTRVFAIFEYEEYKRLALTELEVADREAIFNIKCNRKDRTLFRGENVLDVNEPPEPDNILWHNLQVDMTTKRRNKVMCQIFSLSLLVTSYFIISSAQQISASVLSITVVFLDTFLYMVFRYITELGKLFFFFFSFSFFILHNNFIPIPIPIVIVIIL